MLKRKGISSALCVFLSRFKYYRESVTLITDATWALRGLRKAAYPNFIRGHVCTYYERKSFIISLFQLNKIC